MLNRKMFMLKYIFILYYMCFLYVVSVDDIEFDWNLLFPVRFSVFIYAVWLRDYLHSQTDNQGAINGLQFMIRNNWN